MSDLTRFPDAQVFTRPAAPAGLTEGRTTTHGARFILPQVR